MGEIKVGIIHRSELKMTAIKDSFSCPDNFQVLRERRWSSCRLVVRILFCSGELCQPQRGLRRGVGPGQLRRLRAVRTKQYPVETLLHDDGRANPVALERLSGQAHATGVADTGDFQFVLGHVITVITLTRLKQPPRPLRHRSRR